MPVTSFDQLSPSKYYTYQDYLTWTFPERVELFLGKVFKMSPAPSRKHQSVVTNLMHFLSVTLRGKGCRLFTAPFDVRLPVSINNGKSDTVVQPDIVVICDRSKLDEQGCNGAPDIVIEILSPGNSKKEMKDKFDLYEASLVKEYWIIDPSRNVVTLYNLDAEDKYIGSRPYIEGDVINSNALQDFSIEVSEIFVD